jgi:hypothetical protein
MKKLLTILIAALFISATCGARAEAEAKSRFRSNLNALVQISMQPSGLESLKNIELGPGIWNCRLELDGFLPVVELDEFHPAGRLHVSAISLTPDAQRSARMLILKGLPGYTMKDSNNDKTVFIDRTRELRRVVFTRTEQSVTSTVSVIYTAHQAGSVKVVVEAW